MDEHSVHRVVPESARRRGCSEGYSACGRKQCTCCGCLIVDVENEDGAALASRSKGTATNRENKMILQLTEFKRRNRGVVHFETFLLVGHA